MEFISSWKKKATDSRFPLYSHVGRTQTHVRSRGTGVKYHTSTRLWSAWWEQSRYYRLYLHRCRAPSELSLWSEAGIGRSQCNTLHCRSRTASKTRVLQQPFHFSPSGLTWSPWPLGARGKSSLSSGFQSGFTSLQGPLLECVKYLTVQWSVMLGISHLYLKKKHVKPGGKP